MMEAGRTSETLVNFYQTTRHNNPEDSFHHTINIMEMPDFTLAVTVLLHAGKHTQYIAILPLHKTGWYFHLKFTIVNNWSDRWLQIIFEDPTHVHQSSSILHHRKKLQNVHTDIS
ncbi:hypothetical protein L798_13637 [Zootermopsis nevadensis]|uniref:Uncharacterized protein n=1 Tax=Zootermopsis nevadensis TaxID=136037 RepID=A0A067QZW9_ZOONE|nr:hypothetical protein L798_13637 [Zootermopsis nevadensis]